MENKNAHVPAPAGGASVGAGPATEQAPVNTPSAMWLILEKGIMTSPSFKIVVTTRQTIKIVDRDVELEMDRRGLSLKSSDEELVIDPRYNTAVLYRGDRLVAVSDKVRYVWRFRPEGEVIYETKDFAMLIKNAVKELIEEAVNLTSFP